MVAGSAPKPKVWYGAPFGAGVWGTGYVVPAAKLYQPIWKYSAKILANDLAHLVHGLSTAAAFRLTTFTRRSRR